MAAANTVFYYYSITITYHDPEDKERPFYQNGSYWTQRRITFGPDADHNEVLMDFMNDKLDSVELRWVTGACRFDSRKPTVSFKKLSDSDYGDATGPMHRGQGGTCKNSVPTVTPPETIKRRSTPFTSKHRLTTHTSSHTTTIT